MTSGAATNFVKRQMLGRSVGQWGGINTRPELTPSDDIQAKMNDMSMQGGGEICLGPYEYRIESKAQNDTDAASEIFWTIPENVTLVGVPNKTIIYKKTYYQESFGNSFVNIKSLGPVISLAGGGSSIIGCTVYLDLLSGYYQPARAPDFRAGAVSGVKLGAGGPDVNKKQSCIIYVGGNYQNRRIQNCTIGSPTLNDLDQVLVGVYIDNGSSTKTLITNNFFMNRCSSEYSAGIYVLTNSTDNAIVGNISRYAATDFISIYNAANLAFNVVSGNVPSNAGSSTSYGLRV